jgi:hypothetical protein
MLLEAEGVGFVRERVDLKRFKWDVKPPRAKGRPE